jgi:hypothetical protein
MAISLNSTLASTSNAVSINFDTQVPELIDPANIIEAFAFYHYGGSYDGGGNPQGIAGHLNTVNQNIENHKSATTNIHGLTPADGSIVGTTSSQNLSNKTYITPNLVGTTTITGSASVSNNLTVSANLVVDTDTLFVDSANNRVGVGTATPSTTLDVINPTSNTLGAIKVRASSGNTNPARIQFADNAGTETAHMKFSSNIFSINLGGTDRVTVNSTTGIMSVVNPSINETGVRNITASTTSPTTQGNNGDVWIVYV